MSEVYRDLPFDADRIGLKEIDYLRILKAESGEATTTRIREMTGMSNEAVRWRHEKLEEMGLVELRRPGMQVREEAGMTVKVPKGPGEPTTAVLTEIGEEAIDRGLLSLDGPMETSLDKIEDRVERIAERQRKLEEQMKNRLLISPKSTPDS